MKSKPIRKDKEQTHNSTEPALPSSSEFVELRKRAEQHHSLRPPQATPPYSEADIQRLVHELEVHIIELELQNEELQLARADLEAGLERYSELYEFAPVGYFSMTREGSIQQTNLSGARLLGVERSRVVGAYFGRFIKHCDLDDFNTFLFRVFASWEKQACEVAILRENNDECWVHIEGARTSNGQECRCVVSDITDRKRTDEALRESQEILVFQNTHDALTGLYNRQYFGAEMERLQKSRQFPIGILMMDVDGLKKVNDFFGHHAGDDLLRRTATLLKHAFRPEDMVARIGGDEFVVILPDTDTVVTYQAEQRLRHLLEQHNEDPASKPTLSLSIGSACGDKFSQLSEVLKQADRAMYLEKHRNK